MLSILMNFGIIPSMSRKQNKQKKSGNVIIPNNHPNPPTQKEVDVAVILSSHYQIDIEFIIPVDDYKRKSADILMFNVAWEIKGPVGNSKSTIGNQFKFASKQSKNIVLDTNHTKLDYDFIVKKVQFEIKKRPAIKKVILIDKSKKVVEFKM